MAGRRAHRSKWQLPPCYYEGFLEKRSFKDKVSRKLWTALCGNALFFYNNSKDNTYVEKKDLSNFIDLTDDPSIDHRLDAARLHLQLNDDDIYLTAPSLEARELWKGFILAVVKLEEPASLNLLPGQIHMLRDAVAQEKERLKNIAENAAATKAKIPLAVASSEPEDYLSIPSDMPACFQRVSRDDAEILLEKYKAKGNFLLRPSRDGTAYAASTRQDFNGSVFKHYKVTRIPTGGFAIAVDNPICCDTLHDVVNYLMEKTRGAFIPLVLEHTYEESIEFIENNNENGEKSVHMVSKSPALFKVPPIPALRKKNSNPGNIYLNSSEEEENTDAPKIPPRVPVKAPTPLMSVPELQKGPGRALLPPTAHQPSAAVTPEIKLMVPEDPAAASLSQSLTEELKEKLKLRAAGATSARPARLKTNSEEMK